MYKDIATACAEPSTLHRRNTTLSQNIDTRILDLQEQIERLIKVKQLLSEPSGILNVPLDDLRFAMSY